MELLLLQDTPKYQFLIITGRRCLETAKGDGKKKKEENLN